MISRNAGLWMLINLACFFSKSHFLSGLFALGQYFVELHKCRFLSWIAPLYSVIKNQKCILVHPVWMMCRILNIMFSWKTVYIREATARMWIFFWHQTFLLTNYIDLMENGIIYFHNTNIALFDNYHRFYSHLCS